MDDLHDKNPKVHQWEATDLTVKEFSHPKMGKKSKKKRSWEIEDIYLLNGIGDACGFIASEAHPIIELPIIDLISLRWSSKPKC